MVLVDHYETTKSRAFYFIHPKVEGQEFGMNPGIEDPKQILKIAKVLQGKGIEYDLFRQIVYNSTKGGYLTKGPEEEDLTVERLEEIIEKNEPLPSFQHPVLFSTSKGFDIGE